MLQPGHPESEKERLASWLRLPRRARIAIRRLHRNMRHRQKGLVQLLRAARAPQDYFSAAKTFRCQECDNAKRRSQTHTKCHHHDLIRSITKWESMCSRSWPQSAYTSRILNAVFMGTTYDPAWIVREFENLGSPSSHACLRVFVHGWTRWAGWPKLVRCDRGTHNRGIFCSTLAKNGV